MVCQLIESDDFYTRFTAWSADHSDWSSRDLWWACKYDQAKYPAASHLRLYLVDGKIVGYRLCADDDTTLATDGYTKVSGPLLDDGWRF
jgi:hypothetical protein